jgi:hypothetical protein
MGRAPSDGSDVSCRSSPAFRILLKGMGEASEVQPYAAEVRFGFIPGIFLSEFWMYSGVFFAIIGVMARCISRIWIWDGRPEPGRALDWTKDMAGDSCTTIRSEA